MIEPRIIFWNILLLIYIIIFPLIRNLMAKRNPIAAVFRNFMIAVIGISIVYSGYLVFGFLGFGEFQLFTLMILGIYMYYSYPKTTLEGESESIETSGVNKEVLVRLNRAFHGNIIEDNFSLEDQIHVRRYLIPYTISPVSDKETLRFFISSGTSMLFTVIHLLALYAASSALDTSSNPTGTSVIGVPLLGYPVDAVVSVISLGAISVVYLILEYQIISTFTIELPLLYKKLLKVITLEKLKQTGGESPEEYQSELEKARDRARQILEKRNSDVLNKKREKIRSKVDGIFDKDTPALDSDTLERFRLMKTVERILQSTPPWAKVSLKQISELAGGKESDVELIIAGLRQSGDVPGIYDIWTKTYSGSKQSQWYITELLHSILEKRVDAEIENIKVFPDGSAEISIKKND